MKINKMIRWAIACGVAMLSVVSVASDIAAGKWERYTFDGSTPAIGAGEGLFLNGSEASFSFASDGTLTLPIGNVFPFGNPSVGVRSGVLQLTASSTPDLVANPPSELQKAELWLDATRNVKTEVIDAKTYATGWYDARESSAAASGYGYAEIPDTASSNSPQFDNVDGKACVGFRAYEGNKTRHSFLYKAVDGTAESYDIRHAFFVSTRYNLSGNLRTAPVLGNTTAANFFAVTSTNAYTMLTALGTANPLAYSCEYLLDGVHDDPTAEFSMETHLHEFTLPPNRTVAVDSLMNDRNSAAGGLRIHEILLFTEPLTVVERMRITAYLKAKWGCGGAGKLAVHTASGTAVEVSSGVPADSVAVMGEGSISVGSSVSSGAAHLYSDGTYSRAPYSLTDNTSSLELQAAEYEYRLSPNERLSVSASTRLSTLTKTGSEPNGSTAVDSERNFIVSELDPAVTNLTLSGGGDLVLRAPASSGSTYETGTVSCAAFAATSLSIPSGKTGVATTVDVPVAGDWEIEFQMSNDFSNSSSDAGNAYYRVYLTSENANVWEKNPTVVSPSAYNGANQYRRYLIRNLAAGTYTFRAEGKGSSALAASLSDLAMKHVPNPAHETIVPVTDGDFEASRFQRVFYVASKNNVSGRTGWTLTNGELPDTQDPPVQTVVSSSMGYSGNYDYMFRSSQLGRYGDNALLWYHNNSTATSPETTLPSGTWKLRLDAVRWMTATNNHPNVGNSRCNESATLAASVTVNGGEPVALGEIGPITNFTVESLAFPTGFAVSEGDVVTVVLTQATSRAAVQIDNLEFVKVENAAVATLGVELVEDGSFSINPSEVWSLDDWTGSYRHIAQIRTPVDETSYGTTLCEGPYALRTANGGRAYQTISFPSGVFRLSWWSRARVNNGNVSYRSPLTFWYAEAGSETTNVIVRSENSWCTNFLEHIAYFSVPVAGNYVFGFNADDASGTDVLVDCVSVKQVLGPETTPDIPEHARINVTGGGKLRLDYNGCLRLTRVRVNGKSLKGEISAEKFPDLVSGPGKAFVSPWFVMSFR